MEKDIKSVLAENNFGFKKRFGQNFITDKNLLNSIVEQSGGLDNVEVVFRDFLKVNLSELEQKTGEYAVIANLPYYVTTPLITKLLEEGKLCKSLTVMVQEEVALRLCAKENTPDYGAITAVIALRADAEIIKKVPRRMFTPQPNVTARWLNSPSATDGFR